MLITRGYWDLIGWNMLKHGETLWNCFLAYIHLHSIFPGLKNATRKSFSFIHCFASSNKSQVFFIFMSFHVLSIFVRHVWLDKLHPPISFGSTFIFSWIQWIQHSIHVFTGWWWLEHVSFFHSLGNVIIPTDFHSIIFQRGRAQPPTRFSSPHDLLVAGPIPWRGITHFH